MKKARYFYSMMLALAASGVAHARVEELSCEPQCTAWEAQAAVGGAPQASLQAPARAWPTPTPAAASYAAAPQKDAPVVHPGDVTPVPEAPTYLMLLIGLGLLMFARHEARADNFSDQTFR